MKTTKIVYFAATGLLSALMLFSAGMYFFNHAEVVKIFGELGYPSYIVYPLAIAKLLGLAAIWSNYSKSLKEWAYAGFFYDFLLALAAHVSIRDGGQGFAIVALVLLAASYISGKKLYKD